MENIKAQIYKEFADVYFDRAIRDIKAGAVSSAYFEYGIFCGMELVVEMETEGEFKKNITEEYDMKKETFRNIVVNKEAII